jgi:Lrp/AsnC family transcriptional regulator, leucine-responsive regulatory protein
MNLKESLDDIDKQIITFLQKEPNTTHSEIARQLDRSQPAIGARIKKLQEKGVLATQIGVDFKKITDLNLVKVEMITSKPENIFDMADHCPYLINVLKLSGEYNISLFMACSNLKRLDSIIDRHFRNQEWITKVKMDLVTDMAKSLVFPIDFAVEEYDTENDLCKLCTYKP